jgi:hypothetical protein
VPREATVRFYVDADLLGLAKVLAPLRPDLTYPGDPGAVIHKRRRPACQITSPSVKDTDWVPVAAERGWLILTRDLRISTSIAERRSVLEHGARMVALWCQHAGNKWVQLELVMRHWRRIEKLTEEPGPFIYRATYGGLRPVRLS